MLNHITRDLLIIICCLFIFVFILFYHRYSIRFYETDYFGKILLKPTSTYQEIVSIWNNPKEIVCNKENDIYEFEVRFDGFSGIFMSLEPKIRNNMVASSYRVYSDKFKFGINKIGVGSSRNEIESAYEGSYKTKKINSSKDTIEYFDNHISVTYYFDENNIVKSIHFYYYY